MNIQPKLNKNSMEIIEKIENYGYKAYFVGGCVRDWLLQKSPNDIDICTNAKPTDIGKIFTDYTILYTGLKHGTVTLIMDKTPYEITTFRCESDYKDNRHPQNVFFVNDLKEDLLRRDFTINAMAYNQKEGLIDYFSGVNDIKNKIIKCVGNSEKRFSEDALRIIRALRFASTYSFSIHQDTLNNAYNLRNNLSFVSCERLNAEFSKFIMGDNAFNLLYNDENYKIANIIGAFIPEILPMINFNQQNPHHCFDVWKHTLIALNHTEKNLILRLAVLFHDIGKPDTFFTDENNIGHFYGHNKKSYEIAKNILKRLRFDRNTTEKTLNLILNHDIELIPTEKYIKKLLLKFGEEDLLMLFKAKYADSSALADTSREKNLSTLSICKKMYYDIIKDNDCFSLKKLAINGSDLIKSNFKEGKSIGTILNILLDLVINDKLKNEKEILLNYAVKNLKDN